MKRLSVAAALLALASGPAHALTFNFTDVGGAAAGSQARRGYEVAAAYWSSVMTNTVTVNLDIGYQSLGGTALSQTLSTKQDVTISATVAALGTTKSSSLIDADVIPWIVGMDTIKTKTSPYKGLLALAPMVNATRNTNTNYAAGSTRNDRDESKNNVYLAENTAVMKALGTATTATSDGSVVLNSSASFDLDPRNGVAAGANDFVAVAIREIGHVLGFVSGVDTYDAYTEEGRAGGQNKQGVLDSTAVGSVLDLFRYHGLGQLDWSTIPADGDPAWEAYLSLHNGYQDDSTGNPLFGKGVKTGDGTAASNWAKSTSGCSGVIGIMSADLCTGRSAEVKWADLSAFDIMGWNLSAAAMDKTDYSYSTAQAYTAYAGVPAPVPEPATWISMVAGLGLAGAARRRRSRAHRTA